MKKQMIATAFLLLPSALFAQAPGAMNPGAMGEAMISQADANKDGKVSMAEFMKPGEAQFKAMDANGDGYIDRSEAKKFAQDMHNRMQQMRQQHGG